MVFHEVHVIENDLIKLKGYVKSMIKNGHDTGNIRRALIDIGWKEHLIDSVI